MTLERLLEKNRLKKKAPEVFMQASMQFNICKEIEASVEITSAWFQCVDAVFYRELIYYLDRSVNSKKQTKNKNNKNDIKNKNKQVVDC